VRDALRAEQYATRLARDNNNSWEALPGTGGVAAPADRRCAASPRSAEPSAENLPRHAPSTTPSPSRPKGNARLDGKFPSALGKIALWLKKSINLEPSVENRSRGAVLRVASGRHFCNALRMFRGRRRGNELKGAGNVVTRRGVGLFNSDVWRRRGVGGRGDADNRRHER